MMGLKARAFAPLVQVSLEELVPPDHFYRQLERTVDLAFVREFVRPFYAAGGRPPIDPVVFFKLQLVMFFEDLRSEHQLLRVAADRLSVRWYLGYDFAEALPDHSSLTKIRTRYGLATFRRFFDQIVEQCRQAGLVWGQELYFDATQVEANADRDTMVPRFYADAITAHLTALFPEPAPAAAGLAPPDDLAFAPAPIPLRPPAEDAPPSPPPPPKRQDWITEMGRPDRRQKRGGYQRMADLWVSTTDPDASLMRKKGGGVHLGYHTHYVVDGGKARIILAALVTPSEVTENQPMLDLLWRVCFRWQLHPRQVTGDTTYGTIENIVALEDAGIRAYMPLPNFETRTPFFGKHRFIYEADADQYRCPGGAVVRWRTHLYTDRVSLYQADAATCNACPLKAQCTDSENGRTLRRHFDEAYLDRVRGYHQTAAYARAMRKRQVWVEPLFGEAKAWHRGSRFRLRTLPKVNIEGVLLAAGQNLKRLVQKRGWGRRPGPTGAPLIVRTSTAVARSFGGSTI